MANNGSTILFPSVFSFIQKLFPEMYDLINYYFREILARLVSWILVLYATFFGSQDQFNDNRKILSRLFLQ